VGQFYSKLRCTVLCSTASGTLRRGDRRIFRVNRSTSYSSRFAEQIYCHITGSFRWCVGAKMTQVVFIFLIFRFIRSESFRFISFQICLPERPPMSRAVILLLVPSRPGNRRCQRMCMWVWKRDGVHLKRPKTCTGGRAHTYIITFATHRQTE
jgi:hypothetical protein